MSRLFRHVFFLVAAFLLAVAVSHAAAPLLQYGVLPFNTANVAVDTATLTLGQMTGSAILVGTPTADANYTTPTATALCSQFPFISSSANNRWSYTYYVKNTSAGANTITMVAGSGVTVVGTATIAQNAIKAFKVVFKSCSTPAIDLVSLGSSTF